MTDWRCAACGGANPGGMRFCGHCGTPAAAPPPPPALDEERRLVTALFADLSGFTGLASQLDPEELQEVIDPVLSALAEVIARYEGQVEKFAGDAVLALFGVPVGHEDDARRALLTAQEMHRALTLLLPTLPTSAAGLTLHAGVDTGHVVARLVGSELRLDYGVLGDCVVRAQRLESAAPAGATYVGESTWRQTHEHFALTAVGPLVVKGFADPVPAWRLEQGPSPAAPAADALVGRAGELAVGRRLLDALPGSSAAALAVVGEAGSGKTRLLQELRSCAAVAATRWVQTQALPYQRAVPYALLQSLVRDLLSVPEDATPLRVRAGLEAAGLSAGGRAERRHPFEVLLGAAPDAGTDPELFRQELVLATRTALSGLLAAPAVVALEDLQWVDPSSSAVLGEVLADLCDAPLLLVLSGRDRAQVQPLVPGRLPADRVVDVRVGPLDPADVAGLVAALLAPSASSDVDPAVLDLLVDRTGGNPFFVRELVRSLVDGDRLALRDGAWRLTGTSGDPSVPQTVDGVISSRLDALSVPARRVLQRAAVIGREVPAPLLAAVADDAPALAELQSAGVLEDCGGAFRFPQALTHDVAYARLLRRHRRRLHQQVGEAAEALYGDSAVDLLARHYTLGARGPRALSVSWRAASRALQLYANAEAEALLASTEELARENPDEPPALADVLLATADLQDLLGRYEESEQRYRAALAERSEGRAWSGAAASLRKRGHHEQAQQVLAQGSAALPPEQHGGLALERGRVRLDAGDVPGAVQSFEQALALLPPGERAAGLASVHLAGALLLAGRVEEAGRAGFSAHRLFEQWQDLPGLALTKRVLGGVLEDLGRLEEAAQMLRDGVELAERLGHVEEVGGCLINLGLLQLALGDLDAAVRSDQRALEHFERVGHGLGQVTAAANLAEKLGRSGRLDEALTWCDRAEAGAVELGDRLALADLLRTRAQLLLAQGDSPQAESQARRSAELFDALGASAEAAEARAIADGARTGGGRTSGDVG